MVDIIGTDPEAEEFLKGVVFFGSAAGRRKAGQGIRSLVGENVTEVAGDHF
jgi:hypothetical protein